MRKVLDWCKQHVPRPTIHIGNPSGNPNGFGIFIGIKWEW